MKSIPLPKSLIYDIVEDLAKIVHQHGATTKACTFSDQTTSEECRSAAETLANKIFGVSETALQYSSLEHAFDFHDEA